MGMEVVGPPGSLCWLYTCCSVLLVPGGFRRFLDPSRPIVEPRLPKRATHYSERPNWSVWGLNRGRPSTVYTSSHSGRSCGSNLRAGMWPCHHSSRGNHSGFLQEKPGKPSPEVILTRHDPAWGYMYNLNDCDLNLVPYMEWPLTALMGGRMVPQYRRGSRSLMSGQRWSRKNSTPVALTT